MGADDHGLRPCGPGRRVIVLGGAPQPGAQANRARMTVASTAAASTSASSRLSPEGLVRIGRAYNPMRTTASTLSTNTAVSQTE